MNPTPQEPIFATQLDSSGRPEKVDITLYCIKILCSEPGCLQIRYVKNQDRSQVDYCKPHARKARLASRARRAREGRARKNNHP